MNFLFQISLLVLAGIGASFATGGIVADAICGYYISAKYLPCGWQLNIVQTETLDELPQQAASGEQTSSHRKSYFFNKSINQLTFSGTLGPPDVWHANRQITYGKPSRSENSSPTDGVDDPQ